MAVFVALILAASTAAVPTLPADAPRPSGVVVTAMASVEVIRAERIGGPAGEGGLLRQHRQVPGGVIVDFN